jgi:MerR family mercuric resistance operon transcriptional regulator
VNVETIRYYQRIGLLPRPQRPAGGGIRQYGPDDLARVRFIKAAQGLGFALDEVGSLLKLQDGTHCGEARRIAERKLEDVRSKLADLSRMETALATLVAECRTRRGNISCPLIDSLLQS